MSLHHPRFSRTWHLVRNAVAGVTVTAPSGEAVTFSYCPMRISTGAVSDDLDYELTVELGDVGEIVAPELAAIADGDAWAQMPALAYMVYRSDDLSQPIFGPIGLQVKKFTLTREGAAFTAVPPTLSMHGTGEIYSLDRFPMLRGLL